MQLSIIVPVYNEERTVSDILKKLVALRIPQTKIEIIIVDDGSKDTSVAKIKKLIVKNDFISFIRHNKNLGKGAAVIAGIKKSQGDYILIQDADLEYDPLYIRKLIKPLLQKQADVIYGTRLRRWPNLQKDEKTFRFLLHYLGNRTLSLIFSILYTSWLTDIETCYKIFPRKAVKQMHLFSKGFEFEAEITAKLVKMGYRICEVPITTKPRGYEEGKKLHTFSDGFKTLWAIIKYRLVD